MQLLLTNKKRTNLDPDIIYPPTRKVFLFTNARNERHLPEWAFHHLLIGFNHVFIFDHLSQPPIKPFDRNVTIIRCNKANPVKLYLMNVALQIAIKEKADWFIYLDADEFIILNKFQGIKQMLNQYHYAHSLSLNWLMFGSNNHIQEPPGLILENYTRSDLVLNQHVKTFVRPREAKNNPDNPHYYLMKNQNRIFNLDNQIITSPFYSNPTTKAFSQVPAYIAHYVYQSEDTYINRKIKTSRDDNAEIRGFDPNLHQHHNEVENLYPKNKYAKRLSELIYPSKISSFNDNEDSFNIEPCVSVEDNTEQKEQIVF